MAGTLTKLLLTILPTRTVLGTQRKLQKKVFEFKNPKAIQVTSPRRNYYDYTFHTHWCNPNFPKIGSAEKMGNKDGTISERDYDILDKLPEEFFTNRGIENHRVPFDYWYPMWKKQFKHRLKSVLGAVMAVILACVLPIILIILNNMR